MTEQQRSTIRELIHAIEVESDSLAKDALHDLLCESGFPNIAKEHVPHLFSSRLGSCLLKTKLGEKLEEYVVWLNQEEENLIQWHRVTRVG